MSVNDTNRSDTRRGTRDERRETKAGTSIVRRPASFAVTLCLCASAILCLCPFILRAGQSSRGKDVGEPGGRHGRAGEINQQAWQQDPTKKPAE